MIVAMYQESIDSVNKDNRELLNIPDSIRLFLSTAERRERKRNRIVKLLAKEARSYCCYLDATLPRFRSTFLLQPLSGSIIYKILVFGTVSIIFVTLLMGRRSNGPDLNAAPAAPEDVFRFSNTVEHY